MEAQSKHSSYESMIWDGVQQLPMMMTHEKLFEVKMLILE